MFARQDLLESFDVVDEDSSGHLFFQYDFPKKTFRYCLKSCAHHYAVVGSENVDDRRFASAVLDQLPDFLSPVKATLYSLQENSYGFTHAIAVPKDYHGHLKGDLRDKRDGLFLCVPIFKCEFSGSESEVEFKQLVRMLPIFEWNRDVFPKLNVYFDNPSTGAGTDEEGALFKFSTLVLEVENLNGVVSGFIEITNYKGDVIEVLSPAVDAYTLIRNRCDDEAETPLSFSVLMKKIAEFSQL